jgi:hypothetical protein
MSQTFVIDLRHYLDEHGEVAQVASPAVTLAHFCAAIVGWTSGWPGPDGERTNVFCRRVRSRPPCHGEIYARLDPDGEGIRWRCRACGEQGTISGWRGTRWDRSPA